MEDDLDDVVMVTRILKRSTVIAVDIRVADNRKDFCDLLKTFAPDVILADYRLPQFSGMEALQATLTLNITQPFIFVTGTIGEELAAAAILSGANGFVLKSNLDKLNEVIYTCLLRSRETPKIEHIHLLDTTTLRIKQQIKANQEVLDMVNRKLKKLRKDDSGLGQSNIP
ncbi:MAG: response regulator [Bacteroidia bacterium]